MTVSNGYGLLQKITAAAITILLSFNILYANKAQQPKVLPQEIASKFCDILVFHNDRICPMQTLAIDLTTKLYGKPSFKKYSAEQVFTGLLFFYEDWIDEKPDILTDKDNIYLLSMMYDGSLLKIFPIVEDSKIVWKSQIDNLPEKISEGEAIFIRRIIFQIKKQILAEEYAQAEILIEQLKHYQQKNAGDALPSPLTIKAEKLYHNINYTKIIAIIFTTLGLLSFCYYCLKISNKKAANKRICKILLATVFIVFTYLTLNTILRWIASKHIPITNGHETMIFMSWCTLLITICLHNRFKLMLPAGILICGMTMMVVMMGQSNPQIALLNPALSSPLLSFHVVTIMISYSLLAFTTFNGIAAIIVGRRNPEQMQSMMKISKSILSPAVICLGTGIIIGAIWAKTAWGRFWGWDPKEVWALITFLVYALSLHHKLLPTFNKPRFFHIYMILAFLCVLFTYFGVNYILGGLHSYV